MAANKKIVILGASYAGLSTAHSLLKHTIPQLPDAGAGYQVVVVSPSATTMCRPACPRAMIADSFFDQDKLFVSVPSVLAQYPEARWRFLQGFATSLDTAARTVAVAPSGGGETETLEYYALVVATGAQTPSPLMSLSPDNVGLKAHWAAFREALSSAKSIVIAGGGASGVETAGELGEYLNGRAAMFSSRLVNPKVSITLVSGRDRILPVLPEGIAANAEALLAKVGVTLVKGVTVASTSPEGVGHSPETVATKATVTLSDGKTLDADIYIPATGFLANSSFFKDRTLLASNGRVLTNAKTFRVERAGPRVYSVGDVSDAYRPAIHNTLAAVPVAAANIKRDILLDNEATKAKAAPADKEYTEDTRPTQMVPIGKSKGVGAFAGWSMPSWFVWGLKGRDYWLWTTGNLWSGKQWNKEA